MVARVPWRSAVAVLPLLLLAVAACTLRPELPPERCFARICNPDATAIDTLASDGAGADAAIDTAANPCAAPGACRRWARCVAEPGGHRCECGPGTEAVQVLTAAGKELRCAIMAPVWGTRALSPRTYKVLGAATVSDEQTGLTWQRSPSSTKFTALSAREHCDSLGEGGYDDWRIPSIVELLSIVDFNKATPALDTKAFPGATSGTFWTGTVKATNGFGLFQWTVELAVGASTFRDVTSRHLVRCVRDGPSSGAVEPRAERFVIDAKNGTVLDRWTKLTWQRASGTRANTSAKAASSCETLPLAGGGWHLPNVRQLHGLTDFQTTNPATDTQAFPNTAIAGYWSSTRVKADGLNVWAISFGSGGLISVYDGGGSKLEVRCVR